MVTMRGVPGDGEEVVVVVEFPAGVVINTHRISGLDRATYLMATNVNVIWWSRGMVSVVLVL